MSFKRPNAFDSTARHSISMQTSISRLAARRLCLLLVTCLSVMLFDVCALAQANAQASNSQTASNQQTGAPFTQTEFVAQLNRLLKQPELRAELIAEIRRRGIGFEMTDGLRALVATRSRSDAELLRTLKEAERRRANPIAHAVPPAAEAFALLEAARVASREAAGKMPDFMVKQYINRQYARGTTRNWIASDRLIVLVTFREAQGERYQLLAKNDLPVQTEEGERSSYEQAEGTSSTGEFASMLTALFSDESKAQFKAVDTDEVRGHRTIVYEYEVKQANSRQTIKASDRLGTYRNEQSTVVGYQGKIWIDRETKRVVRFESTATDIPAGFPITSAINYIDYEWALIEEDGEQRKYLMPLRAELELTSVYNGETVQSRNDIRFRGYRKYGSKVTIIEDDDYSDMPQEPPTKP